jgi:type VI secretion system protein ImpG
VELYFYLNQSSDDLENGVTGDSFALGCAAAINLFRQRAEAMLLTETTVEYQIVPDSRRPGALEIYSIDQVTVTERTGAIRKYVPFFGLTHASAAGRAIGFWHAARRPAGGRDQGTETFISLVDLNGTAAQPADATASIETTCLNRDLPAKLPFGAGRPHLRLAQAVPGIASVTCLTAPTATLRLPGRKEIAWRLISHLNLNQLSLIDSHGGAEALREILRLYDFRDAPETQAMIDSVLSVKAKRGTARAPEAAMGALCRGLDITIEFDEHRSSGGGVFLFAAVLERFVAHYASINAFTRMTATVQGRAGILRTWLPRAGDLTLL